MKCTVTAPSTLGKSKRKEFLKEAVDKFQSQMAKKTASQEWNHSKENTERFAAAMKEARANTPVQAIQPPVKKSPVTVKKTNPHRRQTC